ncbi:hypothetical protein CM15mP35_10300 [bacterium]|nr:MAG: hypothetical protein CM15mP35_10300 [bacterium]
MVNMKISRNKKLLKLKNYGQKILLKLENYIWKNGNYKDHAHNFVKNFYAYEIFDKVLFKNLRYE